MTFWISDAGICAAAEVWLTKHTQLRVGIYDSVVILCDALVHPRVAEHQAAELHLFPVELWKTTGVEHLKKKKNHHSKIVTASQQFTKIKQLIVDMHGATDED